MFVWRVMGNVVFSIQYFVMICIQNCQLGVLVPHCFAQVDFSKTLKCFRFTRHTWLDVLELNIDIYFNFLEVTFEL